MLPHCAALASWLFCSTQLLPSHSHPSIPSLVSQAAGLHAALYSRCCAALVATLPGQICLGSCDSSPIGAEVLMGMKNALKRVSSDPSTSVDQGNRCQNLPRKCLCTMTNPNRRHPHTHCTGYCNLVRSVRWSTYPNLPSSLTTSTLLDERSDSIPQPLYRRVIVRSSPSFATASLSSYALLLPDAVSSHIPLSFGRVRTKSHFQRFLPPREHRNKPRHE